MQSEAQTETQAHCRRCGYQLRGLSSKGVCPECGAAFDLAVGKTWTRHPHALRLYRRLRWPVGFLLALGLALGAAVGWIYWGWHQEQAVIRWVEKQQDDFMVTFMVTSMPVVEVRRIGPEWLQRGAGRWGWLLERADQIGVDVDDSPEARELPQRMRWLKQVFVGGPSLSSEWLADLGKQNEVEALHLWRILPSDGDVEHVITDEPLSALPAFRHLLLLDLSDSGVRGPGLQHLRHLSKLEDLRLNGTEVGDDAMSFVGQCANLKSLSLTNTRVTAIGIRELEGLKKLEELKLNATAVDESVIDMLASLPKLKRVMLAPGLLETHSDAAGKDLEVRKRATELREARPDVKVVWWVHNTGSR